MKYLQAQYTGGCIHPGIVFGPAVYSGIWKNHWVSDQVHNLLIHNIPKITVGLLELSEIY